MTDDDTKQRLFEVVTYLVTSAPTAYDEPPALAAFRMVDAADRLLALLPDDEFGTEARAQFKAHLREVMTDQAAFKTWLADYVTLMTKEALARAGSTPSRW